MKGQLHQKESTSGTATKRDVCSTSKVLVTVNMNSMIARAESGPSMFVVFKILGTCKELNKKLLNHKMEVMW